MNKTVPEIGDIWQSKNQRIVILLKDEDMFACAVSNSQNIIQWRHKDSFSDYEYVDESKANLRQLFEGRGE